MIDHDSRIAFHMHLPHIDSQGLPRIQAILCHGIGCTDDKAVAAGSCVSCSRRIGQANKYARQLRNVPFEMRLIV